MKIPIENPPEIKAIELHLKNNGINVAAAPTFAYVAYHVIHIKDGPMPIRILIDGETVKVFENFAEPHQPPNHTIKLCDPGSLDELVRVLREML